MMLTITDQYQSLMKMTANDRSVQQYCHSMPQRHRFDRNKCPKALRAMSYDKVKEYCGCYKNTCMPTNCGYKTTCSKSPCGNYCADLQSDAKSCGSCGKQVCLPLPPISLFLTHESVQVRRSLQVREVQGDLPF